MAGQDMIAEPTAVSSPARPIRTPALALPSRLEPLRAFIEQPAVRRSLPAVGTLSALAVAALAWWSFQTPPQRSLFEGLTDADKSAVVSALQASGITSSIAASTSTVEVGETDLQRARILLAGQGLPTA